MPQILKTANEIARDFNQEILLADFTITTSKKDKLNFIPKWNKTAQKTFIKWLQKELPNIRWQKSYPIIGKGWLVLPYMGHVAVIVSEEKQPEAYRKIVDRWENKDGTPKDSLIRLWLVDKKWLEKKED